MNTDGSGVVQLTDNSAYDWGAAWSPDGRSIAFCSDRDGDWEIYVINADGDGVTRLTYNSAEDTYPSWAPEAVGIVNEVPGALPRRSGKGSRS